MSVRIHLSDSSIKEFGQEVSVLGLAQSISSQFAQKVVGARINNQSEISDIRTVLKDKDQVEWITIPSEESLEVIRHSAAHVLAQAVQELWPHVKVTIGPVIQDGFYYDFDSPEPFTDEDMIQIEKKMEEILSRKLSVEKEVWSAKKAIEIFKKMGEMYKIELIQDIGESHVSIYKQGDWFDLCRGPHCQNLEQIGAVKVLSHSSCYWRADESKASLQRVYGTAFHSSKDLKNYLQLLEQAKKRDHRRVGKEMNMFYFHESSAGQPFFKESGAVVYRELQNFLKEKYKKFGYQEVISPQMFSEDVFSKSGHLSFYKNNMYSVQSEDGQQSYLKPMNCPGHCLLYKSRQWSYKNLPWRIADFGRLHRYERSGTLHGLTRVRSFCQDDAHIFCTVDQLQNEIQSFIQMIQEVYQLLSLENYRMLLCTRPQSKMGKDENWNMAEEALSSALKNLNLSFQFSEGNGAFYGPKLDVEFEDSLKRKWQLATLQCDFNTPKSFNLSYVNEENQAENPVMLHRAVLGSIERFMGIYIEHCGGWFPTWLAPIQMTVMNISEKQAGYAQEIYEKIQKEPSLRVQKDLSSESLSYKIRKARTLRIPYIVIVGQKEKDSKNISVRVGGGSTAIVDLQNFLSQIKKETFERKVSYSSF